MSEAIVGVINDIPNASGDDVGNISEVFGCQMWRNCEDFVEKNSLLWLT